LRTGLHDGIQGRVEVPYRDRAPAPRWLLALAAVTAALTAISIVTIDQPLARWISQYQPLPIWDRILGVLEWGLGLPLIPWTSGIALVAVMLVTVAVPRWRHRAPIWMFLAASHILGRIAMVQLKDLTGRLRPLEWMKQGGDETFGWIKGISFPSGHVVLFASVIIPLICVWPRARPLLVVVGFAMIARVVADVHFVSDVIGAITVVALVTWLCGQAIRPLARAA
jgi:membrane-associated phospholipid phosphatase